MEERLAVEVMGVAGSGAQHSKAEDAARVRRGRSGRRSVEVPVVLFPGEKALRAEFGTPGGVPWGLELRSDHGPQYTGSDCEAPCHYWGIEHTLASVGRPTGSAVAKRLIQTPKVELIWTRDWETIAELREAISVWMEQYNHLRPHQALDWETPAERRAKNLRRKLELAA